MKVYEYVVLERIENRAKIVVPITVVLAKDEKEARIHAARAIPKENASRIGDMDICVRRFCS